MKAAWVLYALVGLAVYIVIANRRGTNAASIAGILATTPGVKLDNLKSAPDVCPPGFITTFSKGAARCVPIPSGQIVELR